MTRFFRRLSLLTALVLTGGLIWAAGAGAEAEIAASPLTQADIDGYIYLLPRLAQEPGINAEAGAAALHESGLSRRRAAYVGAKITIAQALLTGLMSADQLAEKKVPDYLKPSTAELHLVDANLETILAAQAEARKRAAPSLAPELE